MWGEVEEVEVNLTLAMAIGWLSLFTLVSLWANCSSDRILVLVDNLAVRESHSNFFKSLTGEFFQRHERQIR